MIKNILFDLDGTLIESSGDVFACLKKAFNQAKVSFCIKSIRPYMGDPLPRMIRKISPDLEEDQILEIVKQFKMEYDNLSFRGTKLFKGVRRMLLELNNQNFKLFIVTNKRILPTRKILKVLKMDGLFRDVYAFDMRKGREMKKGEMMGHLLAKHKLKKSLTLMVSDNEGDIVAARIHDLVSVAVLGGYGHTESLRKEKPSHVIKTTGELYNLIRNLNRDKDGL